MATDVLFLRLQPALKTALADLAAEPDVWPRMTMQQYAAAFIAKGIEDVKAARLAERKASKGRVVKGPQLALKKVAARKRVRK